MYKHHELIKNILTLEKLYGFEYLARQEELESMATEDLQDLLMDYQSFQEEQQYSM